MKKIDEEAHRQKDQVLKVADKWYLSHFKVDCHQKTVQEREINAEYMLAVLQQLPTIGAASSRPRAGVGRKGADSEVEGSRGGAAAWGGVRGGGRGGVRRRGGVRGRGGRRCRRRGGRAAAAGGVERQGLRRPAAWGQGRGVETATE
eukprot:XP_020406363.1 rRNA 2'-O-methyltransferase fibrillarin-like [Zea mays]